MQNERKVIELPIEDVLPNRFQPRIKFDQNSINELAISIKKYGVIQPIVVRQIGTKYEIIAGERRYKASVMAGKSSIPAIISDLSDKESVEIALIENVQREDLTPIEKAISYKKILDMGYIKQEELAEKVGKSQSAIANTLRLLNLSDEVQEALLENKISERHARSLLKIKDDDKQVKMLNKVISERLTVRKTDEEIDKMFKDENYMFTNDNSSAPSNMGGLNDEIVSIPDTIVPEQTDMILPGFMNIDKIEQDATDINASRQDSVVNMDQLMTNEEIKNDVNTETVPYDFDLHSNKFFNFFDEENNSVEENDGSTGVVTDFSVAQPLDFEMPTFEVPSMPEVETPTFEVPSMPEVEMPTFEVPSMPEVETPTFEVPSMPEVEMPTFEVPSMPEVEIPTFEVPSMPEVEMPTFEVPSMPEVETPAFEVPSMPEVEEEILPTIEVGPIENPYTQNIESSNDFVSIPTNETPNIKLALDAIRECEATLERLGFVLDSEEIDFEHEYQVIFRIQK